MTTDHTTSGITRLCALPDPAGRAGQRWIVSFQSDWPDRCHQLYANGRLAAWTDAPSQRRFVLDAASAPQELVVAACSPGVRALDAADQLGLSNLGGGWQYQAMFVQGQNHAPGDRLEVTDADGVVLFQGDLQPPGLSGWSFGLDALGAGAFGHDGSLAPGLGEGGFGAGGFGFGAFVLTVNVPLTGEGPQSLVLRAVRPGAPPAILETVTVKAIPPPPPVGRLSLERFESQTSQAIFAIEKG